MNRSIQMYEYRQVILQMRLGESDRAIAKSGLVSRTKARQIRAYARHTSHNHSSNIKNKIRVFRSIRFCATVCAEIKRK